MRTKYDVVVVGAGHNGLVCAAYLAKGGLSVCVLERRSIVGGAAASEKLWPGYKVSTASYVMSLLQPKIILDLELQKYGFEVLSLPPVFHPLEGNRSVFFKEDERETAAEFAKIHGGDGEAFLRYRDHLRKIGPYMQRLLWEIPPDPGAKSMSGAIDVAKFAWRFRDIGNQFYEVYDLLTLSAFDYLSRWFSSDDIKTVIGFYAGCAGGHFTSPHSPGTAFVLIRPMLRAGDTAAGSWGFMKGGMGSISEALSQSAKQLGAEIRLDSEVKRILTRNGRAMGVELANGDTISCNAVVANASAFTTFTKLVPETELPAEFVRDIRNARSESSSFKMNIAVDRLVDFPSFQAAKADFAYPAQIRIAPSMKYMHKAFTDVQDNHFSQNPTMLICVPSLVDPTLAPEGKYVINIFGNHAPYTLRGTNWDEQRDALTSAALKSIDEFAPGFSDSIVHSETLTPLDLERRFDLPRGHIHHIELTADQIFFKRPAPHYANYQSPIAGLYQCGASTHPGGGVTGVPGFNASKVILRDRSKIRRAGANAS
ncbi:phytoene desaturase family protein (plasmid) [Mesorhizobium sp. ORM8.1]